MIPLVPRTNSVGDACVAETDAACCPGPPGAVTLGGGWLVSRGAITIGFVVVLLTAASDDASFAADAAFFNLLNRRFKRFVDCFNFLQNLAASIKRCCFNVDDDDDTVEFALFPSLLLVMKSSSLSSSEEEEEDESEEEEDETLGKTFPREDDDDDDVIPDVDADADEIDPVVGADDDDDDDADDGACRIVGDSGIAMLFVCCTVAGQVDTAGCLTATAGCGVDAICAIGGCAPI